MKKISKLNKRFNFIKIVVIILFAFIIYSLYKLIIVDRDKYILSLEEKTSSIVYGESSPRGRIYDRNYKLLVDNKSIPVITYTKQSDITSKEEIELAYRISKKINVDYSKLNLIDLKEFWIIQNKELSNKKITDDEWLKLKNRKLNLGDINKLKIDRITKEDLSIYDNNDKEAAYIYYLMNKGYSYEEKVIKNKNISNSEYAYVAEHSGELKGFKATYKWERVYLYGDVFRSMLGNISSITLENKEEYLTKGYSLSDLVGVSYIEKQYESILVGEKAIYELNNGKLKLISEGKRGNDIVLTIDIDLQKEVENILKTEIVKVKGDSSTKYYNRSYVVIQEPNTGEILAMSGKQVLKINGKYKTIDVTSGIFTNPMTVGSVVKGASMLVGYNEGAISIGEKINDSCIKIYMNPKKCSWTRLGLINDINALAYSSNVFQFKTAMKVDGFTYYYNRKFKAKEETFNIYRKTFNQFGLGVKTEIDLPVESIGNIGTNMSSDLLLNFAIGQYDTYTTMQLSQYITTIASNGNRYKPHLLKEIYSSSNDNELGELIDKIEPVILNKVDTKSKYIKRIQKGFKAVLDYGLGKNIMGNSPSPAGKTGTSESFLDTNNNGIIDTETISKAFVGYAPYNKPVMSITVTSPDLLDPDSEYSYSGSLNHRLTRLISDEFFEINDNN